jgi:hypothetical protein
MTIVRSDQKGMEEVQRIREALAEGRSVLSEAQEKLIRRQSTLLGEDGDAVMQAIQEDAVKTRRLPADVAKVIEKCCQDLGRRVARLEKSNEVEKEKEPERLMQIEGMREQVSKCAVAREKGNMADLIRVKVALPPLLLKYLKDLEAEEKEGLSPDVVKKWKQAALDLIEDVMKYVGQLGVNPASGPDDILEPLRRAIGETATLSEAVTMGVQEPDEEELCDLAKKLGVAKKELMAMVRELVVNQPAATATEAHELVSEAGEAIKASREMIKAALRGMGAASDISEISCLAGLPRPPRARPSMGNLAPPAWPPRGQSANPAWPPQSTPAVSVWPPLDMPPRATPGGAGDELAILMQGLMGAQANDSGWPTFSGKYAEYPWFRKEWWAYRQTYHGHVRDELACRSLKERSLASSVKILVNDIEDLREAWNRLYTCFDRPKKYIAEALEPIVKFRSYKMFDNGTIREFYSLLRAAMMGARKAGLLHWLVNDQTLPSILAKMPPNDWRQWARERPTWMREASRKPSGALWTRSGRTP